MRRFQRTRYLSCFYCGIKQTTPYDGQISHFECPRCEATNYLDEKGQITDPPVEATETVATPAKYAVPRTQSPPSSPDSAIFCSTCITNQHLLRSSLAQYLPDPDDPDYEQLEKNFYRFRNAQEKRYPQLCADCEPKVRDRLRQAAYTAKADLLRHMIDRSAKYRKHAAHGGPVDFFDALGRWLWIAGLLLQLCWHVALVQPLYLEPDHIIFLQRILQHSDWMIRWSTCATLLGMWWNPRFAQVFRGFTQHLRGVSKWYAYQCIAAAMRIVLLKFVETEVPDSELRNMYVAGHLLAAGFAILIFIFGRQSIRIDMSPLFKLKQPDMPHSDPAKVSSPVKNDETKSISELLEEISAPSLTRRPPSPGPGQSSPALPPMPPLRASYQGSNPTSYDEMDWSPTQNKAHLSNPFQTAQAVSFHHEPATPTRSKLGGQAFVPRPRVLPSRSETPWMHGNSRPAQQRRQPASSNPPWVDGSGDTDAPAEEPARYSRVDFRETRFFPPARNDDATNSLLDSFGTSLDLGKDDSEEQITPPARAKSSWLAWL